MRFDRLFRRRGHRGPWWERVAMDYDELGRATPRLSSFTESAQFYYAERMRITREPPPAGTDRFGRRTWYPVRVLCTWGLIARGAESVPFAMRMIGERDPDQREDGATVLGAVGRDEGAVDELLAALSRETETTARDTLIQALGRMRSRRAIPALTAVIRDDAADGDTRWTAVDALESILRRRFTGDDRIRQAVAWLDAQEA